jgi:GNAT superfamily N-acetyltransferase
LRVCHRRRLRSAISVCPPLRLLGSSASRLGAGRPGPGRAALNELSGPLLTIHDIPQRGQKRRPVHGLCCILLPTPRAWHQDGPGELRKRQPVDRGRGLRYSCPPSGQGRCSRNRVGVELLRSSRRRRWIRRRYRFALPRRVDACGALAGSQRRRGEEVLVAEMDGRIVGYVTVEDRGGELELVNINVPLQLQGRGIGTILVRSVEERARAEGSRQSLLARAGTQRAWLGSHFPGGNTSGTSSPTKRKTSGPGQSDRGSARYDCGKNS